MMQWIIMAFRNILRNKRRSLVTLIAIGVGFAAISLYYGYLHSVYWGLQVTAIRGEGLGHLRINKAGWQEKGKLEPEKYMFTQEEIQKIIKLVSEEKGVVLCTPQIQVTGMVSNGITSAVFLSQGVVPKDDKTIKGGWAEYSPVKGQTLSDERKNGVEIAKDLSRYLDLTPGKDGVVMAPTLEGQMNALDIKINGVYDTGNDFANDKFMRFNFSFAQSLLETQAAERLVVLLEDEKENDTEMMRTLLLHKLKAAGIDCEIKTWKELSLFYTKATSYLDKIFMFLFSIVIIIVMMTTVNTMSMAILERTKEIGTLRSLGLKRRGISFLFALEGAFLGLLGSLVGIVFHTFVWGVIKIYPPRYVPPGFSDAVPIYVDNLPLMLIL
jgi:putative ABC transport system permease protein